MTARLFYCVLIYIIIGCITGLYCLTTHMHIDFCILAYYNPGKPSILLDDQGQEWARFALDKREPITYQHLPQSLIHAFVAAEDWNFFEHHGISYKGILRSLLANIYHRKVVQGASTITQQLVKLLFFDQKKTFIRKIKEQLYALLVERQFTKEHIFQTYVNHVYFGCGIYGVEAASLRFWNQSVSCITIAQAATLAGIVKSPGNYCPLKNPLLAQKRRNTILSKMHHLKFITKQEYQQACTEPMSLTTAPESTWYMLHAKEVIRAHLESQFGKEMLYKGGLVIQTTLNRSLHEKASQIFTQHIDSLRTHVCSGIDGAVMSMHTHTGAIKVYIGGYHFAHSQFNRVQQAYRQMGSTFKPLIYAAALQRGIKFSDTQIDEPLSIIDHNRWWTPHNFDNTFSGRITLAYALARSNNIVAIKTFLHTGAPTIIHLAKACHLPGPFYPYPSLALGCTDATLYHVASYFNIFACNGNYIKPYMISWVKDQLGTKIYTHHAEPEHILSSLISDQVAHVLGLSVDRIKQIGRYTDKQWIPAQVIAKTGTTNESRTCWFVGSTPEYTTAVYVGCDDNRSMGENVYPIKTAFPIWLAIQTLFPIHQKEFIRDPRLRPITIDAYSGEIIPISLLSDHRSFHKNQLLPLLVPFESFPHKSINHP